jgi:hypothetical protein
MKPGLFVLVLLMLVLVVLPIVPEGDGSMAPGTADQTQARAGTGVHGYRSGIGAGAGTGVEGNGMMAGRGHGPMPDAGRHGQERSPAAQVERELQRDPFDWNATVRRVLIRGYRRLSGKNILDHEKRNLIYSNILLNPGIDIASLSMLTGINLHTLRYHLGYLVRMRKVVFVEKGGGYHFFENHGRYGDSDQQEILFRNHPTASGILSLVQESPGITRGEIAEYLGLAGPSVTRWMHRLTGQGMVSEERDGRYTRYYLAGSGAGTVIAANPEIQGTA